MVQREWSTNKCLENSLCYVHFVMFTLLCSLERGNENLHTSENGQRHNRDEVVDKVFGCHPG